MIIISLCESFSFFLSDNVLIEEKIFTFFYPYVFTLLIFRIFLDFLFHSLWNNYLLIRIAIINRYRIFPSSEQNWIKYQFKISKWKLKRCISFAIFWNILRYYIKYANKIDRVSIPLSPPEIQLF
jgi:hypothetical protein